jgi:AAA domain
VSKSSKHANPVPVFRDNPFIQSLSAEEPDQKTFAKNFNYLPAVSGRQRTQSGRVRMHSLLDALNFRVALPRHYDLDRAISRLIRWGYTTRDPTTPGYWREFRARFQALRENPELIVIPPDVVRRSAENWGPPQRRSGFFSGLLLGVTGGGKTVSVERDLDQYEQVIDHGKVGNQQINIRQVVWLKVEASKGLKDLAMTTFAGFDQILGTNYYVRFRGLTEYEMLLQVANLAFVHALGLLVVDEFQSLEGSPLIKFFLRLSNVSRTPVLGVGTYKVEAMFAENAQLRLLRRYWGAGVPKWEPLDLTREWPIYFGALWRYQVTRTPTPPHPELSARLYEECQGIPDFATRVYFLMQDWLIARNYNGRNREVITPGLISQIAETHLKPVREVLQAIKRRDATFLENFDDVRLPPLDEVLAKTNSPAEGGSKQEVVEEPPRANGAEAMGPDSPMPPASRKANVRAISKVPCKLVEVVGRDNKNARKAYDALSKAGFIKSGTEFWGAKT